MALSRTLKTNSKLIQKMPVAAKTVTGQQYERKVSLWLFGYFRDNSDDVVYKHVHGNG